MSPEPRTHVELSRQELRILVLSLQNCVATCRTHAEKPDEPCEDCDAARALLKKLQTTTSRRGAKR